MWNTKALPLKLLEFSNVKVFVHATNSDADMDADADTRAIT